MNIVDRIKLECKKNDLNIALLEKKANLSNGIIGKWATKNPTADNLYKVALVLNCSMEYLLTGQQIIPCSLSFEQQDWLNLYNEFSSIDSKYKDECIGFVKGYLAAAKFPTESEPSA